MFSWRECLLQNYHGGCFGAEEAWKGVGIGRADISG